jgi:hypothetical protein
LFVQPDPVQLQARILRPTEVGCRLPAMGNAELSRTNRALTCQRPRAPPEVHGIGAIPPVGSKPSSTSDGIHEERRELKCEAMVVFRFGPTIRPPRRTTWRKGCSKDRLHPKEQPIEGTMKRKRERHSMEQLASPKRNNTLRGRRSLRLPSRFRSNPEGKKPNC